MMDEKDLIARAAKGDLPAFEALVVLKRERVFWIAYHLVGDAELAKDVTQEVFLRLYRVMRRFRQGGRFDAWLYRITMHLGIDALRRERPHRGAVPLEEVPERNLAEGGRRGEPAGSGGGAPGAGAATGESLRQREIRRIFVTLSALLTPRQREAFILREIEGLETAEVAAILRTSASTIRNHILQARRILQAELRRRYPEYCPPE
jgi:RNA polymerase sigma-70 factor (ECF subfamily)